jgi:histidinol-phosphate aminotransferase
MMRPHWKNEALRDKKYKLDRNESYDTVFHGYLKDFFDTLSNDKIFLYPSMPRAYKALVKITGMPSKNLFLTSGSEQGIKQILENNMTIKKIAFPEPTFKMVEVYCKLLFFDYKKIPYRYVFNEFDIDLDIDDDSMVYLASPDNPTGYNYSSTVIDALCKKHPVVILDEAYCKHTSCKKRLLEEYDNLYIVRTFSKYGGAAGLRVGYIMSCEQNINRLYCHKPMYEINSVAVEYLNFLSNNLDILNQSYRDIAIGKTALEEWLHKEGCRVLDGCHGNFALFERNDALTSRIEEYVAYKNIEIADQQFTRITAPSVDCVQDIINYAS